MDRSYGRPELLRSEPVLPRSSQEFPSSPPSVASDVAVARKPRRPPPVTPRSFKRFFTPRSMLNGGSNASGVRSNRLALKNLKSPAVNRIGPAFTRSPKPDGGQTRVSEPVDLRTPRTPSRKRKLSFSSIGSPLQSSPTRRVCPRIPIHNDEDEEVAVPVKDVQIDKEVRYGGTKAAPVEEPLVSVSPIRRSSALRTSGGLYMRNVLGSRANRTTIRSNSGTGWLSVLISHPSNPSSPCFRLEGFDLELLFPPWRQSLLWYERRWEPCASILYRLMQK